MIQSHAAEASRQSQAWAAAPPCPVCDGASGWFDVVDFNRNCSELQGVYLPFSGHAVYYALCAGCGFCFAPELHRWSPQQMAERIYNSGYAEVDPDYLEVRPQSFAKKLQALFPGLANGESAHLDYGSGSGRLSGLLCQHGWQSVSYDPFVPVTCAPLLGQKYAVITAFEVLEHVADLPALVRFLREHLADAGLLVFSTLLSDGQIQPGKRLSWWYAGPRNGHISLFGKQSLGLFLKKCGLDHFWSLNAGLHIASREPLQREVAIADA